jgi:hypothetical protein
VGGLKEAKAWTGDAGTLAEIVSKGAFEKTKHAQG